MSYGAIIEGMNNGVSGGEGVLFDLKCTLGTFVCYDYDLSFKGPRTIITKSNSPIACGWESYFGVRR